MCWWGASGLTEWSQFNYITSSETLGMPRDPGTSREQDFEGQWRFAYRTCIGLGETETLVGHKQNLGPIMTHGKEQWSPRRLSQTWLWVFEGLPQRHGSTVACCGDRAMGSSHPGRQLLTKVLVEVTIRLDSSADSMDMSLSGLRELVMDREAQQAVVHRVAKSRTRLSDWTELIGPAIEPVYSRTRWPQAKQLIGREQSPTHQQRIKDWLNVGSACQSKPPQSVPHASPSHQEACTRLLTSSVRGQTEELQLDSLQNKTIVTES